MESTVNFRLGLEKAYKAVKAEGKLETRDERAIGTLLSHPVLTNPTGEIVHGMKRAHARVRRYYRAVTNAPFNINIDWDAIWQWIKDHWLDIVKIIASLLPFLFI